MSDRPWMPLDIDDYLADTSHLSAAEHGAYMLLIMRYWKDGGLPTDERLIQRYALLSDEQWGQSRGVLAAFFADGWRHGRIDAEIEKASGIIEKRREAAKKKHRRNNPLASAEQMQSTSSDTGVPPVTDNPSSSLRSDDARRPRRGNPIVVLQSEVDAVTAQRWVAHCEDKGKRPSIAQAEETCAVLRDVRARGGNPIDALTLAIRRGWTSVDVEYLQNAGFKLRAQPTDATPASAETWVPILAHWRETGDWNYALGPPPGAPGSRVPPELLTQAA